MDLLPAHLLLGAATLVASVLQSATGVGFGLIAGPFLLMTVAGPNAIAVSGAQSLLIAAAFSTRLLPRANGRDALALCAGCALGLPLGVWAFVNADAYSLKIGAACVVTFVLATLYVPRGAGGGAPGRAGAAAAGFIGGLLGGCLAMPGPSAAVYLVRAGRSAVVVRATMFAFFLFAFSGALSGQVIFGALTLDALNIALALAPVTIAGLFAGQWLSHRLSERVFAVVLKGILAATIASLIYSVAAH